MAKHCDKPKNQKEGWKYQATTTPRSGKNQEEGDTTAAAGGHQATNKRHRENVGERQEESRRPQEATKVH